MEVCIDICGDCATQYTHLRSSFEELMESLCTWVLQKTLRMRHSPKLFYDSMRVFSDGRKPSCSPSFTNEGYRFDTRILNRLYR